MRTLVRNKIRIYYANYRGKIPIVDEYGNRTGEYKILYHNPIPLMANVSAVRGESTTQPFGEDEGYDRIIVLDNPRFPISVTSILWIDAVPEIAEGGSTSTPHDYIVKRVAPGLNSVSIAVSRVSINPYPQPGDVYTDLIDDGKGNVSILSNVIALSDDGVGNVNISTGVV